MWPAFDVTYPWRASCIGKNGALSVTVFILRGLDSEALVTWLCTCEKHKSGAPMSLEPMCSFGEWAEVVGSATQNYFND